MDIKDVQVNKDKVIKEVYEHISEIGESKDNKVDIRIVMVENGIVYVIVQRIKDVDVHQDYENDKMERFIKEGSNFL